MKWIIPVTKTRKMPAQKPHRSEQKVGTPWEFIEACEKRFGKIVLDIATTPKLAKADRFFTPEDDAFTKKWYGHGGVGYLNPEFGNIRPWAERMAKITPKLVERGELNLLLVPASVGSHWFADHVWDKALVLCMRPRLKFIGHTTHFPKDLILCVYGEEPGIELWEWNK